MKSFKRIYTYKVNRHWYFALYVIFLKAGSFYNNLGFFEELIWVYVKNLIGSPGWRHTVTHWHRHTNRLDLRGIVVSDGRDWVDKVTGQDSFFWCPLLSRIVLFLLSSTVSLSYFNLAVLICKCLGKHSFMSSSFSIDILNGTCSLRAPILFCGDLPAIKILFQILQTHFKYLRQSLRGFFPK